MENPPKENSHFSFSSAENQHQVLIRFNCYADRILQYFTLLFRALGKLRSFQLDYPFYCLGPNQYIVDTNVFEGGQMLDIEKSIQLRFFLLYFLAHFTNYSFLKEKSGYPAKSIHENFKKSDFFYLFVHPLVSKSRLYNSSCAPHLNSHPSHTWKEDTNFPIHYPAQSAPLPQ
jgi:hypothetical protein